MQTVLSQLSTLNSPTWTSNLNELSFKQFQRTYSGGFVLNFVLPLSGFVDTKSKNYSNFFLTSRKKASDFFEIENTLFETTRLRSYLQFGGTYLGWEEYATSFKLATFRNSLSSDTYFDLNLFDNQICTITTNINGQTFYLVSDVDNFVFLAEKFELDFESEDVVQPYHFKYMYDENRNYLYLFQEKADGYYSLTKTGNIPTLTLVTLENKTNVINNKFLISKDLITSPNFNLNTSFISYNNDDNNINPLKSATDLQNNFLLHNKISDENKVTDIIILKNQMDLRDKSSSSNNLLSGEGIYADNMRNYTSINDTIPSEQSSDLELNYVFYNKHYEITSGKTRFIAPSSMYPFTSLNINDTKFVDSGAFSFDIPAFSDKVYRMDRNTTYNDQHYLCTWLSGSPLSDNKIWVDRYYYPDLISKADALTGKAIFNPTYDDLIEELIAANTSLGDSINRTKFFDKISDMVFEPSQIYVYDRISPSQFGDLEVPNNTSCSSTITTTEKNYFKTINQAAKITFSFYFLGDSSSWVIASDRNNINCGITVTKSPNSISFEYVLYDPSTGGYQTFQTETTFKHFKENFVCFSLDFLNGRGYIYLNNDSVLDIDFPVAQYIQKQLLYGDIFFTMNGMKTNILDLEVVQINTVSIQPEFTPKTVAFTTSIFNGKSKIDDIKISLPCGMMNNFDNIHLLQTICGNDSHRSNRVNIKVKNLNINNSTVITDLSSTIQQNLRRFIPATTVINDIQFINFK